MMTTDGARDRGADIEPTEIEALLPWYEAGTLGRWDRQRVEEALRGNPALARHAELVREELAETICLNESLGAPSARVMNRLMAAIEVNGSIPPRRLWRRTIAGHFAAFIAGLSPRTVALAGGAAVLAIVVQTFLLVNMIGQQSATYQTASLSGELRGHGTFALVRFDREASAAEITRFLENYQATLVDGPKPGGLYRVRLAMTRLAKDEFAHIVARMRQERVVASAEPSE